MKDKKFMQRVQELADSLPPTGLSLEELAEQVRKTDKNVSIRPTEEQTRLLIYLDLVLHFPKAEAVKLCLQKALPTVIEELRTGIANFEVVIKKPSPPLGTGPVSRKR